MTTLKHLGAYSSTAELYREAQALERDAIHVRQANTNYREENRLAIERATAAESRLREVDAENEVLRDQNFAMNATIARLNKIEAEPIAYAIQSVNDGGLGNKIAPIGWSTFKQEYAKLEQDKWVQAGRAKIVPLYAALAPDRTESPTEQLVAERVGLRGPHVG